MTIDTKEEKEFSRKDPNLRITSTQDKFPKLSNGL